ncbi:Nif3-like dinuclear metal center hexameric protein [Fundicoccus sp. Sow4_D5]|uniref:Nif3-like dinuclear metal center hexameric protein n=1 Tax=unclassified Fundicoccus TaxID=2761543 RepID=UPI003F8EB0FE
MSNNIIQLQDLTNELNAVYPEFLAENWDQNGLHFGRLDASVNNVMVSLDIRPNVVEEAINKGIDTIIVHHPPLFKAIQRFDLNKPDIAMYADLIKHDINVFAMHTNFDAAHNGMNDWLAQQLELVDIQSLVTHEEPENPGIGRVGRLKEAMTREELLVFLKEKYQRQQLVVIEKEPKENYQVIGIVGGAGSSFMHEALANNVDVFITGDVSYHQGHDFYETGFMTIDAGHYIESIFVPGLTKDLQALVNERHWNITVTASQMNTNPFSYE